MRSALLLLLCLIGNDAFATNTPPVITGRVYDLNNDQTLPGVHVIYKDVQGVITDSDGRFIIEVEQGQVTLTFQSIAYTSSTRSLNIGDSDTVFLDVGMVPDVTKINEIVVSAGKTEQKISDLTVSMSILKPYQIGQRHVLNAEELLQKTSGIEILDGQASIRGGSGYSYGAGSRVLTLIDGMPALSADAGNIKWSNLPLENISRIEIIKGASSVLYGSSALNGVINIITRDAGTEPLTRLSLSAGIFDKPARKEWLWWDTPRMVQNLSFSHAESYGATELGVGIRLMNDMGYRLLDDEQNARISLSLKRKGIKNESLVYGLSLHTSYTAKIDFLLWEDATSGGLKQSESSAMEFRGSSFAMDPYVLFEGKRGGEHSIKSRFMTNLNRLPDNTNNNSDSHSAYLEYQYQSTLFWVVDMIAGASQQYSVITSNFYGNHNGLNLAAFTQFNINLSERLKALAGIRLEYYQLDGLSEDPVPIFRAGLNYKLGQSTFLRGSFGQGYRYPSIAEKHAYTSVGSVLIFPNEEIKSETGWSSELGLKQIISSGLVSGRFDASVFFSRNKNMIEYVFGSWPDPISGINGNGFRPINIENSRVYGFETELILNRTIGNVNTTLNANYTFLHPVEYNKTIIGDDGAYLKYRRKHSANFGLNTHYRRFSSGISFYYKSKLLDVDDVFLNVLTRENILPGFYDYWQTNNTDYILADINLGYRLGESYNISFVIKNLFNKEYMGRPGDIQPHRFFSLQFTATL